MQLKVHTDPAVSTKWETYPQQVRERLLHLRSLILATAEKIDDVNALEETLKWGEPSYLAKKGSTIRIDWKDKSPDQYAMYFKCTSKLVETFQQAFPGTFRYEKTRAILFGMEEVIPEKELCQCIELALTYHRIKHLPMLGL
ncbi:MAG: DUF1801 domain-containing protein [Saprospiraceae bacterium]|nr:DUF1801 domain-containing protein [Saprospiraceae bacterium]